MEEEDDQLDDYGSDSSDETNQEIDSDDDFDFSNCDTSERSKVQKTVTRLENQEEQRKRSSGPGCLSIFKATESA